MKDRSTLALTKRTSIHNKVSTCNMNVIYTLVAIGAIIKTATAADVATNRTKFDNFILGRCNKYSNDLVSYDKVKNDLDKFTDYFKLTFSHLPHEKKTFCDEEKPGLVSLMRDLAKEVRICLPKAEKYLPQFMYDSFREFLEFLCDDNGRNIDNFFSTSGKECLSKLKNQTAGNEVSNCFRKIVAPLDSVVEKDRLCEDLDTAKKCFSVVIKKHCPETPAFETLNSRFFRAVREPCKSSGVTWGISSFVLLASILVHKMI